MAKINHYNEIGKKIGSSSYGNDDDSGCFFLIIFIAVIIAIITFLSWCWEKVSNWQMLDTPYNYLAAFYYYIIAVPIKVGINIWGWLSLQFFTPYPNLNLSISVLGIVLYIIGINLIIRAVIKIFNHFDYDSGVIFLILIAPSILGGIWFILLALFNWFFAVA